MNAPSVNFANSHFRSTIDASSTSMRWAALGEAGQVVAMLAGMAADLGATKVAGIEARGFIFGTALALRLGVGFVPIRKAGKLPVECIGEDYALEYGEARVELDPSIIGSDDKVLVVDDLLATGGTALPAVRLLRRAGAEVSHALFVIDLPELGGAGALAEEGITTHALID
ncbi:adenine phosphoribosyltransferase, partial [Marivirga lumbricoides]|uniref:adenine phosphoribosyltransferase n=1 Tax=Marivirga lumbricoides TaxID=1046115 RepID=UPI0031EFC962